MKPPSIQAEYQKYPSQVPVVIGHSCSQKEMSRTLCKQLRWVLSQPNDEEHSEERVPRCCRKHVTTFGGFWGCACRWYRRRKDWSAVGSNQWSSCGLSITSPADCGEGLESHWHEEFVNPNLDTLHIDLTFSTHLKQTAQWNDTLYEVDPCKIAINKVFANKHSKYVLL